jgi:phage portal protein BeeE
MPWKEVIHEGDRPTTWGQRIWQRLTNRSITLGPWNPKDRKDRAILRGTADLDRHQRGRVQRDDLSAVWAAVQLISGSVASVPLRLYKRLPKGGKEPFREHRLYRLLHDEPNPEMSSFNFREVLQGHLLLWGNAYAEIERDTIGRPVALWPLMPYAVTTVASSGS